MSKRKHSKEFKLRLLKEHAENGVSFYQLEKDNNLSFGMVRHWFAAYIAYGEAGLICSNSMLCRYSAELKRRVVEEYVAGGIWPTSMEYVRKTLFPNGYGSIMFMRN